MKKVKRQVCTNSTQLKDPNIKSAFQLELKNMFSVLKKLNEEKQNIDTLLENISVCYLESAKTVLIKRKWISDAPSAVMEK